MTGRLGTALCTLPDPRGGSTAMFVLHVWEELDEFEEASSRGSRQWHALGVVGTPQCAAAIKRLGALVSPKPVHQQTIARLEAALPRIAAEAEAQELAAAGRSSDRVSEGPEPSGHAAAPHAAAPPAAGATEWPPGARRRATVADAAGGAAR